jgi:hypothetical protein
MTRKDYELIAFAVLDARPAGLAVDRDPVAMYQKGIAHTAHSLADALASQNTRFNRERFLKACGVES